MLLVISAGVAYIQTHMAKLIRPSKNATKLSFRLLQESVPKDTLARILSTSADPRVERLVAYMFQPMFRDQTLESLAVKAGLVYGEVLRIITQAKVGQGILEMSEHVPGVMVDTAIDAQAKDIACPACRGTGEVIDDRAAKPRKGQPPDLTECWTCQGSGWCREPGDTEKARLVFDAVGLTGRRGPSVQVNVGQTGAGTVEDDIGEAARVLDATPVVPGT
jgi:hypothetical protein